MSIFLLSKPSAFFSPRASKQSPNTNRPDKGKAVIQSPLRSDMIETSHAREPKQHHARNDKKPGLAAKLFASFRLSKRNAAPPNDSDIFSRIREGAQFQSPGQMEQKGNLQMEDSIPSGSSDPQAVAIFMKERRREMEAADKDISLLRLKRLPADAMTCEETYTPLADDKNMDALFFREIREKQGAFKKKHRVLNALKAILPGKKNKKTFNQIIEEGKKLPPVTTEEVIFNLPKNQSAQIKNFLWDPNNWVSQYKYYPQEKSVDAVWGKIRQDDTQEIYMPSLPEDDEFAPQQR